MTFHIAGWPQAAMLVIYAIGVVNETVNHGKPQPNYNAWTRLVGAIVGLSILWAGGFFS